MPRAAGRPARTPAAGRAASGAPAARGVRRGRPAQTRLWRPARSRAPAATIVRTAARAAVHRIRLIPYSTVTVLARLRGWSTSQPAGRRRGRRAAAAARPPSSGDSSQSAAGTVKTCVGRAGRPCSSSSSTTAITRAPRGARPPRCCDMSLSCSGAPVATKTTGVSLVDQRDRPVLHLARRRSPRRGCSVISLSFSAPSMATGDAMSRPRNMKSSRARQLLASHAASCALRWTAWSMSCGMRCSSAPGAHRLGVERAADVRELQAEQVQRRDLGDERLRGGDADLDPGAREQRRVGVAGGLRAVDVGHGDDGRALLARRGASRPACRPSRRTA